MIDIKLLRSSPEIVKSALARRGEIVAVEDILKLDQMSREAQKASEDLQAERNRLSREIGQRKSKGEDASELIDAVNRLASGEARDFKSEIESLLLGLPNLPDDSLPLTENRIEKVYGETRSTGEAHWDIALRLGLCDFERGTKIAGSRFYVLTGLGARLERALIAFMLDRHIQAGYTEVIPPFLANIDSMTGTGQYPKFADEYFTAEKDGLSLIPTGEVPITNMHRDEIVESLPIRYVGCTACFRRESGAAGKDTRGVIRVHQFNKVEIVKFVSPDASDRELMSLLEDAESILEALDLPYRRVLLAANDIGFASAKTYDLEVWMAGTDRYVEISSCSNFKDFQARRMRIRFRRDKASKAELVHTINGSALAVGRTWAAVLENGLQPDGSVLLPPALVPYMAGIDRLKCGPSHP